MRVSYGTWIRAAFQMACERYARRADVDDVPLYRNKRRRTKRASDCNPGGRRLTVDGQERVQLFGGGLAAVLADLERLREPAPGRDGVSAALDYPAGPGFDALAGIPASSFRIGRNLVERAGVVWQPFEELG